MLGENRASTAVSWSLVLPRKGLPNTLHINQRNRKPSRESVCKGFWSSVPPKPKTSFCINSKLPKPPNHLKNLWARNFVANTLNQTGPRAAVHGTKADHGSDREAWDSVTQELAVGGARVGAAFKRF